ncbi:MAG: sporulation initiation factor Spo0A C-terminal domain-containing protein [Clostridia bacterium]
MQAQARAQVVLAVPECANARELSSLFAVSPVLAHSCQAALDAVRDNLPEALIADMVLPGGDGLALLSAISASDLYTLPCALLILPADTARFERMAVASGASRILRRPLSRKALAEALSSLTASDRLSRASATVEKVTRILWALGFSARAQGTRCLAEAIELCSRDMRLGKHLAQLYPLVAGSDGLSALQVENAVRRAIESAWSSGSLEKQYRLFGNTIDARRGKPTTSEMIACMAERLRTGMEFE